LPKRKNRPVQAIFFFKVDKNLIAFHDVGTDRIMLQNKRGNIDTIGLFVNKKYKLCQNQHDLLKFYLHLFDVMILNILMNNNDILRRIRYVFDFNDSKMIAIFSLADHQVTRGQISDWLKKDDDPAHQKCSDNQLAIFLNGLINDKRGKTKWPRPETENHLTNNIIFTKLKIALDLKADDVLEILNLANLSISKHELSAFFRRSNHKHYRECKDQILRNFLKGMQLKYRPGTENISGL